MARRKQSDEDRRESLAKVLLRGLTEFGYPNLALKTVLECVEAQERGDTTMPHGVIGLMTKRLIEDAMKEPRA